MMWSEKHPWRGLTTVVEESHIVNLSPRGAPGATGIITIHRVKEDPSHNHKGRFLYYLHTPLYSLNQDPTKGDSAISRKKALYNAMASLRRDFARAELTKEADDG